MKQTIEGYLARDKKRRRGGNDLTLFLSYEPEREYDYWVRGGIVWDLPKEMFKEQTWEKDPTKVTITIESK